jgi:hypothetical protein
MAEAVLDRTANKLQRSKGQSKVIKARKQTWDEINKRLGDSQVGAHVGMDVAPKNTEDERSNATSNDEMEVVEDLEAVDSPVSEPSRVAEALSEADEVS